MGDLRCGFCQEIVCGQCGHSCPSKTNDGGIMSNEEMIKKMVNRFLAWKLPTDLIPDGGITYKKIEGFSPIGTNLLTATQAEAMVRHMLGHGQYCECGCVDVEGDKNQEQVSDLVTNYPDLKGTLIKSDILTITNPPSDPKRKANT